jgi:UV DNA damage endonuclease
MAVDQQATSQRLHSGGVGYACILLGVPAAGLRSLALKRADYAQLEAVILHNLDVLQLILEYNARQGIYLFRISSDIVPLASHPAMDFPWRERLQSRLVAIGAQAKAAGIRLSMHPGQYTVLSSPDAGVVERSVADLVYHADFLELLGMDATSRIILHLGGAYGDKAGAVKRFVANVKDLPHYVQKRLTLENDERLYHIADVLETAKVTGLPVVFDNLHHSLNSPAKGEVSAVSEGDWIREARSTWGKVHGRQKLHYSQSDPDKRPGAHSLTIDVAEFIRWFKGNDLDDLSVDVMLEVKDKNLSAVKCRQVLLGQASAEMMLIQQRQMEALLLARGTSDQARLAKALAEADFLAYWSRIEQIIKKPLEDHGLKKVLVWFESNYNYCMDKRQKIFYQKLYREADSSSSSAELEKRVADFMRRIAETNQLPELAAQYFVIYSALRNK